LISDVAHFDFYVIWHAVFTLRTSDLRLPSHPPSTFVVIFPSYLIVDHTLLFLLPIPFLTRNQHRTNHPPPLQYAVTSTVNSYVLSPFSPHHSSSHLPTPPPSFPSHPYPRQTIANANATTLSTTSSSSSTSEATPLRHRTCFWGIMWIGGRLGLRWVIHSVSMSLFLFVLFLVSCTSFLLSLLPSFLPSFLPSISERMAHRTRNPTP